MCCSDAAAGVCSAKRKAVIQTLVKELDGSKIGSGYLAAFNKNDEAAMIREVAAYFRNRPESEYLRRKIKSRKYSVETAERALRNDFTVINIPWQFDSGINWIFNPTWTNKPVNNEWLWQFGRMLF